MAEFRKSENSDIFEYVMAQFRADDRISDEDYRQMDSTGEIPSKFCEYVTRLEIDTNNINGIDRFPNLTTLKALVWLQDNYYDSIPVEINGKNYIDWLVARQNVVPTNDGANKYGMEDCLPPQLTEFFADQYGYELDEADVALVGEEPTEELEVEDVDESLLAEKEELVEPDESWLQDWQQVCANAESSTVLPLSFIAKLPNDKRAEFFEQAQNWPNMNFEVEGTDTRLNLQEVTSFFNLVNTFKGTYDFNNLNEAQKIQCAYQFANDVHFLSALKCENNPEAPNYDATVSNVFSFILQSEGINTKIFSSNKTLTYFDNTEVTIPCYAVLVGGKTPEEGKFYDNKTEEFAVPYMDYLKSLQEQQTAQLGIAAPQNALEEGEELVKQFVPGLPNGRKF